MNRITNKRIKLPLTRKLSLKSNVLNYSTLSSNKNNYNSLLTYKSPKLTKDTFNFTSFKLNYNINRE